MEIEIRGYREADLPGMISVWNEVVRDGEAFPQEEELDMRTGGAFFAGQTRSAVALDEKSRVVGLYILHPNNIGRCGHLCNASYAVASGARGRGVGALLVRDSLERGRELGFRVMQFNAVVASNAGARRLYESLGFRQLGVIPGGFRMKDGHFEDICPYYKEL